MDELSRSDLMELKFERSGITLDRISPKFYHVVRVLEDIAGAELINRDMMDSRFEPR